MIKRLGTLFFLVLVFEFCLFPIQAGDIFLYLALGKEFFNTGSMPQVHAFTFTTLGSSWHIMHEWFAFVIAFAAYHVGGYAALIIGKALLISGFYGAAIAFGKKRGVSTPIILVMSALAFSATFLRLYERSSLFTDLASPIVLLILLLERQSQTKWIYVLPVLFLMWVNVHPGFPIGFGLMGIFLAAHFRRRHEKFYRRVAIAAAASVAACLVNPRGIQGLLFPFNFFAGEGEFNTRYVYEFMPTLSPLFRTKPEVICFLALTAISIFLIASTRKRKNLMETAVVAAAVYLGLSHLRSVATGALILLVADLELLSKGLKAPALLTRPGLRKIAMAAIAAILLILVILVPFTGYPFGGGRRFLGLGIDPTIYPQTTPAIADKLPPDAHVLNSYSLGCYLIWAWEGRRKVAMDCNVGPETFAVFEDIYGSVGSKEGFHYVVDKYKIDAVMIQRNPGEAPLFDIIKEDPEWFQAAHDDASVLFVKKNLAGYIAK